MVIRRAKKEDVADIMRLLGQILTVHVKIRPDIFVPGTAKFSQEDVFDMIQDDKTPIYVADVNGQVAGYAFTKIKSYSEDFHQKNKEMKIDDLCVDESMRGKKIGEEIFAFLKEEARRLGCYEISLNVWEGNELAKKFYDKQGMKIKSYTMELIL